MQENFKLPNHIFSIDLDCFLEHLKFSNLNSFSQAVILKTNLRVQKLLFFEKKN
jgi:hypothetical protein